jgi:creatinine amidohydrolase
MKKLILLPIIFMAVVLKAQQPTQVSLPYKMEELTAPKFVQAVELSGGICIIPLGVIEQHGAHLPLGSDMIQAREVAFHAARKEYAVVFPPYFVGQVFEAKHHPGALAYSNKLMWDFLDETCKELSRNGFKKIILVNGHGGNNNFLHYFCQSQLAEEKDYTVVFFRPGPDPVHQKEINSLIKSKVDGHAGERETSTMFYINPDLVDLKALDKNLSGLDHGKLNALPYGYTGIWWYAKYPNHLAGDVLTPNKRLGELLLNNQANQLAELVKFLKKDHTIEQLHEEFYKGAENPLQQ